MDGAPNFPRANTDRYEMNAEGALLREVDF
jgi:hypothetical protein